MEEKSNKKPIKKAQPKSFYNTSSDLGNISNSELAKMSKKIKAEMDKRAEKLKPSTKLIKELHKEYREINSSLGSLDLPIPEGTLVLMEVEFFTAYDFKKASTGFNYRVPSLEKTKKHPNEEAELSEDKVAEAIQGFAEAKAAAQKRLDDFNEKLRSHSKQFRMSLSDFFYRVRTGN